MHCTKLGTKDIKRDLLKYVDSFSKDAREILGTNNPPVAVRRDWYY